MPLKENNLKSLWAATSLEIPVSLSLVPSLASPAGHSILVIHKTEQEMMSPPHKKLHNWGEERYVVCTAETLLTFATE